MKFAERILERLALAVLLVGGLGMLISVFIGTADVVGTQGFGQPVAGAKEVTESTMVLIVFGALAYAQIRRSHIRVEMLYTRMPPRVKAALDVFADLAGMTFFGLLLWQAIGEARFSYEIGETADGLIPFPLTPARVILAAGAALMMVRLFLDVVIDVRRVGTGEDVPDHLGPIIPDIPLPDTQQFNVKE